MKRALLVCVVLLSSGALGSGIDGWGRISVGGGYRWVPNWWFIGRAAEAGTPVIPGLSGGPQATLSFGYGATSNLEVSIDLLGGYESFSLSLPDGGRADYSSVAYGVLLGGRLVGTDFPFKGGMPYLSVQAGPLLSNISTGSTPVPERLLGGMSVSGGFTWRFAERYGVTLEARYLYGRNAIPGISGINVGGVWFSAMFTIFFPPAPKRDLDVPGF